MNSSIQAETVLRESLPGQFVLWATQLDQVRVHYDEFATGNVRRPNDHHNINLGFTNLGWHDTALHNAVLDVANLGEVDLRLGVQGLAGLRELVKGVVRSVVATFAFGLRLLVLLTHGQQEHGAGTHPWQMLRLDGHVCL